MLDHQNAQQDNIFLVQHKDFHIEHHWRLLQLLVPNLINVLVIKDKKYDFLQKEIRKVVGFDLSKF